MNKLLQDIKSVSGVSGVMILDKRRQMTYQLLPANLQSESIKRLAISLVSLTNAMGDTGRIDLRFTEGWAIVIDHPKSAVLVLTKIDIEFSLLRLVIKNLLTTLEKKLEIPPDSKVRSVTPLNPQTAELLLKALNQVASKFRAVQGNYSVAQNLRLAKEQLTESNPAIVAILVDPNGFVTLTRTRDLYESGLTVELLAHYASLFITLSRSPEKPQPTGSLHEWTWENRGALHNLNFYNLVEIFSQ